MKTGYLKLCTKLKLEWHTVLRKHQCTCTDTMETTHGGKEPAPCAAAAATAWLDSGQALKPIPALTANPWSTRTCCARNLKVAQENLPEQRFFSPNELSVQQTIHSDQPVTSDITEMAELSQQQKPDDTQSLLYAQPLVSEINKLQTLVNRSLLKTQTGTYIS